MQDVNSETIWDITVPFTPSFVPYNDAARRLTDQYHDLLGLPRTPAKGPKYNNAVASTLAAFQTVLCYEGGRLYWPVDNNRFSNYTLDPKPGVDILRRTQQACEEKGLITLDQLGKVVFTENKNDPKPDDKKQDSFKYKLEPTRWSVDDEIMLLDDFWDAEFHDVGRPYLGVGQVMTYGKRRYFENIGQKPKKLPPNKLKSLFGSGIDDFEAHIKKCQRYWKEQPLTFEFYKGNSKFIRHSSSATRIFSNGAITKGGRFYGMWTNLGKKFRLGGKINGQKVVHIDIKGSQPVLLSGFLGIPPEVEGSDYYDVYGLVVDDIHKDRALLDIDSKDLRDKVKSVIMEMIGTGNPKKSKPATKSEHTYGEDPITVFPTYEKNGRNYKTKFPKHHSNEYSLIAYYAKQRIPAPQELTKNEYNSEFLSYHESQMLALPMVRLLKEKVNGRRVVAYPMHDCLVVAKDVQDVAIRVFRETINDYTWKTFKPPFMFLAALSVEERGQDERKVDGVYYYEDSLAQELKKKNEAHRICDIIEFYFSGYDRARQMLENHPDILRLIGK